MRTRTLTIGLLATLSCTTLLGACSNSPTAPDQRRPAAAAMDQQTTNGGVLVGSGHNVAVASDTTARGGVFVGSGH